MNILDSILDAQKSGSARGIASICSAHPLVLEAVLRYGTAQHIPVLIEATCNQVNQFGGYTGLTPAEFVRSVGDLADSIGFPRDDLLLGGDHLGPMPWAAEPADTAMAKARAMVRAYAQAGFAKIHLDCSTPCADDLVLSGEVMASRAAELAATADEACLAAGLPLPRYVTGTEVPAAGGAKAGEDHLNVTDPTDAAQTIELTRRAFSALRLEPAWERVMALVVQPGVEFGHDSIHEYDRDAASRLVKFIETVPGIVYEAHSTDYQTPAALRSLVEDHFAILKVGPALTFALREAIFALSEIEDVLCEQPSRIRDVMESAMLANPGYWQKHYPGDPQSQKLARQFSFSDRIRYYWTAPQPKAAFDRLLVNLGGAPIPLTLLSQYFPEEYAQVRSGQLPNTAHALLLRRVQRVLDDYFFACAG